MLGLEQNEEFDKMMQQVFDGNITSLSDYCRQHRINELFMPQPKFLLDQTKNSLQHFIAFIKSSNLTTLTIRCHMSSLLLLIEALKSTEVKDLTCRSEDGMTTDWALEILTTTAGSPLNHLTVHAAGGALVVDVDKIVSLIPNTELVSLKLGNYEGYSDKNPVIEQALNENKRRLNHRYQARVPGR